ncbi:hypothetical protein D3C71_1758050 [compost metagenome]
MPYVFAQYRCCKAAATIVEKPDDIAILYIARCRICRVDADRLAVLDLRRAAEVTIIKLAVQPLVRLVANQMQRVDRFIDRRFGSCRIPIWMTTAIVIVESCDRL